MSKISCKVAVSPARGSGRPRDSEPVRDVVRDSPAAADGTGKGRGTGDGTGKGSGTRKDHDPIFRAWSSQPVQSSMSSESGESRQRRPGRIGAGPGRPCLPADPHRPARVTVSPSLTVGLDRTSDVLSDGL